MELFKREANPFEERNAKEAEERAKWEHEMELEIWRRRRELQASFVLECLKSTHMFTFPHRIIISKTHFTYFLPCLPFANQIIIVLGKPPSGSFHFLHWASSLHG